MIRPSDLITPAYCAQQKALHANPRGYGTRGDRWAPTVRHIAREYGASSILDYGCGQGSLGRALRAYGEFTVREYDPAIKGKDQPPLFADLVACTDVLEHIEPDRLDAVLGHLRSLMRKVGWFVISTRPANKILNDGRNAHLIVEPADWWRARVEAAGFTCHPTPPVQPVKVSHKAWMTVVTP